MELVEGELATATGTTEVPVPSADPVELSASFLAIATVLSSIVVCTFVGNLFVIVAILIDKNLQTPANQLVLSLAVADLMVACLVMPLGTYNDIHQGWWLGKEVCEFWTSADVLCCTGESCGASLFGRSLQFDGHALKLTPNNELPQPPS